jgi:HTH-type transcriptional repressor of NAD biosynthesis genes
VELDSGASELFGKGSMTRGLVIGKFMPVHKGHVALIRFALTHCDEVIVSMSYRPDDPIDPEKRFGWLREIFFNELRIKPNLIEDNFDDESLPWPARTAQWAVVLKKIYPTVDFVVSSESYGEPLASALGAKHLMFDPSRQSHPVSASLIREHPFRYWDFIPEVVRPHFVKRLCFYGPESTGKSTLAIRMAEKFNTEFVPEVARELITSNDFTLDDIIRIGNAQTQRVLEKTKTANRILFCDTDLITTQIYSQHYLGEVPSVLYELEKQITYHQYFLFDIDVPWVADGLRDLGERRKEMFSLFAAGLTSRGIDFVTLSGAYEAREQTLIDFLEALLND